MQLCSDVFDEAVKTLLSVLDVAKLVVVLNAASVTGTIRSLLLSHHWHHYRFLLHTSPHLVAPLAITDTTDDHLQPIAHPGLLFLKRLLERLYATRHPHPLAHVERRNLLALITRSFIHLCCAQFFNAVKKIREAQ